jgi:putative restriction endonuclease
MFTKIQIGREYSRPELADLWGYAGYQALARGVVTPRQTNIIILFVTLEKQANFEQYDDRLAGDTLKWEGPNDHFAEDRMIAASTSGDAIHLFCRRRHHSDFIYCGEVVVTKLQRRNDAPSRFVFRMLAGNVDV